MLKPLQKLLEIGKRNKTVDQKALDTAHDALVNAGASCAAMSEAAGFSNDDIRSLLNNALRTQFKNTYRYPWISDIYDDNVVFSADNSEYGSTSQYYRIDYTVDDTGVITLGTPVAVVRKVTYIEPTTALPVESSESALFETDLEITSVDLVERAVANDGSVMLKLISPGKGSSGIYSEALLKRDGPKIFTAKTHNLIDHPTAQEERERPEGSIEKIGSVLQEDAQWFDSYVDKKGKDRGAGLYAKAIVKPSFRDDLDALSDTIGVSIRASGQARKTSNNEVIIESIDRVKSVDYVTHAGRGGEVIALTESAKNNVPIVVKDTTMAIDETAFLALQESNRKMELELARIRETQALGRAQTVVEAQLRAYPTLLAATRQRLLKTLPTQFTLSEAGTVDETALIETVKQAVTDEMTYLSSMGVGTPRGLGSTGVAAPLADSEYTFEKFKESLTVLDA